MKTAKRRIISIIMGLTLLITAMFATTISASAVTITPVTPSYPMQVSTVFTTTDAPSIITDMAGTPHYIPYYNFIFNDVNYTSSFATVIPGANSTIHALWGYPSAMDAIYSCYGIRNSGNYTGWHSGWDTSASADPKGAYVDKMFGLPQITLSYTYDWDTGEGTWKGYSWQIYMNTYSTADTWDASTKTGKLPYYASDIQVGDGDVVVCRFMYTEEEWVDE